MILRGSGGVAFAVVGGPNAARAPANARVVAVSGRPTRLGGVNYDDMMPLDPFADDPNDPASFIDDDEVVEPLSDRERAEVTQDLGYVRDCMRRLRPRGILGIYFQCEDCQELHYYDWEIMEQNMLASLRGELPPVHEPSADPNVDAYVPWDYAMGYLDGLDAR